MDNGPPQGTDTGIRIRLFDCATGTHDVPWEELAAMQPASDQLLWIDVGDPDAIDAVWEACRLPPDAADILHGTNPILRSQGEHFWLRVVAASGRKTDRVDGIALAIVAGPNLVVSLHAHPIPFIEALFDGSADGPALASLSSESFVATLLDWQLSSYFDAVSDYENAIERVENDILAAAAATTLEELRVLRRWASRLRRMLAPHRVVFGGLSRPDFRPSEPRTVERHFEAIDTRFERAMDMVENTRDLVLGTFDLFSSKTALQTNDRMKVLTFVTVITGTMATLVGALGMNFQAQLFQTRDLGFWVAIGGMLLLTVAGLALGKRRRWY